MPLPGKAMIPFGSRFKSSSLRRNGAARPYLFQSGLHTTWWTPLCSAQRAAICSMPGPPPWVRTISGYLALALSSRAVTAAGVGDVLAPGDGDQGPLGQVGLGFRVLPRAHEIAGVDGGGGEMAGAAGVRSVARAPDLSGFGAVGIGGGIAHLLEGVAAAAEVARPVGEQFQLAGVDLGAVLGAFQVAHGGDEPVGGAVDPPHLGVEHVDEPPEQALALVGELGAVGSDVFGHDAEGC